MATKKPVIKKKIGPNGEVSYSVADNIGEGMFGRVYNGLLNK